MAVLEPDDRVLAMLLVFAFNSYVFFWIGQAVGFYRGRDS